MTEYEHILVKRDGDTVTITMNRAARRNSLSADHLAELLAAFHEAGTSDATGVVLAGAGPVFSAGHDFGDVAARDLMGVRELLHAVHGPDEARCSRSRRSSSRGCTAWPRPRAASSWRRATSRSPPSRRASRCPGGKGGWFCHTPAVPVARSIGRKRLMELALTGDVIDAATALDWGLVNRVVPDDELDDAVAELLARATRGSRASKAMGKLTLYAQLDRPEADAYAIALEVMAVGVAAARRPRRHGGVPGEAQALLARLSPMP